jgi:parallel beta-helix repeat protein
MIKRLLMGSWTVASAAALVLSAGCSSGNGTTAGTGGGAGEVCGAAVDVSGCTTVLKPGGADDTKAVQTALIDVKSGSTVCFCPGTFNFSEQLSLTVPDVTVKGVGKSVEDTILDFSADIIGGNDTMLVTADGFTIENLWVKNTPGNGVVVRQADKPTFRKLKVSWDSPASATHGAYAAYPAECTNVLIEDCEVEGASDAAIYVGQGNGAIIRRNKAHDSVLGIELENTTDGEAYGNEVYNNSGGLAVFLLGDLTKKDALRNLLHDNIVRDNNHANFGDPKTFVAHVPVGTGIIVVGADDTEIRNNTIQNNESAGIAVVSYSLMVALVPGAMVDPKIDPNPERTFIHDNTFMTNGAKPQPPFDMLGAVPLESVLWDGITTSGDPKDPAVKFCLGTKSPFPTFRMFDGANLLGTPVPSTDTTPYQCDLPVQPGTKP